MASLAYTSFFEDLAKANIDFDTVTVKVMLVTSAYTPNKDTHTKRSDVTNEITGTGYTAGGATVAATLTKDTTNDRLDITLAGNTWSGATFTARGAVYYVARGGAATADELICYDDFGSDISASAVPFVLASTLVRIQN